MKEQHIQKGSRVWKGEVDWGNSYGTEIYVWGYLAGYSGSGILGLMSDVFLGTGYRISDPRAMELLSLG